MQCCLQPVKLTSARSQGVNCPSVKQESTAAVPIYSQQLQGEEEVNASSEKSVRGSSTEGEMLKNK